MTVGEEHGFIPRHFYDSTWPKLFNGCKNALECSNTLIGIFIIPSLPRLPKWVLKLYPTFREYGIMCIIFLREVYNVNKILKRIQDSRQVKHRVDEEPGLLRLSLCSPDTCCILFHICLYPSVLCGSWSSD